MDSSTVWAPHRPPRILSQDKMQSATEVCRQTVVEAKNGPAIQNNSWGKETRSPMDYGSDEALYDSLVRNADPDGPQALPLTICFSSGNSGALGLTRPKAAKNVIVTGNSESFRPDIGQAGSDDIREVYSGAHGSSYGNCGDGRIRPHVVAPGEWTASANYDCRTGEDEFISPLLTWGGGSSGASPKTAGACALLTQWWRHNNAGQIPSPAMLRALVVNGAEPILTGGAIPNNRQGWGRLNVQNIVDPSVSRVCVDQATFLASPAETREWTIRAADPSRPVKITLAWTDPPGAIGSGSSAASSPIVNKLALRAESARQIYRGAHDRFRNGSSVSDDVIGQEGTTSLVSEGADNLQNIFLQPSAATGSVRVSVTALNVTTNCLTGLFEAPKQDFALVISNATLDTGASPSNIVVAVDHDSTGPAPNGANEHWADEPGNDDAHLRDDSADSGSSGLSKPYQSDTGYSDEPAADASDAEEKAWWEENDSDSVVPETDRARYSVPLTEQAEFARTLDSGLMLLGATHRVGSVAGAAPETGKNAPSNAKASLGDSIGLIKARLHQAAVEPRVEPSCSVLVVGHGTRVTVADIRDLRALSVRGVLYVVSDSSDLLAFLAQRIGEQQAVRYRLARTSADLPDLVQDTLAEAGGMQPVIVSASRTTNGTAARTYAFETVGADRAITIQVRFNGEPRDVKLMRPGAAAVSWSPKRSGVARTPQISMNFVEGVLQIRDATSSRAPGTWTLTVPGADVEPEPSVKVWALGGPSILITEGVEIAGAGSTSANGQRLVKISAEPGVSLVKATLIPINSGIAGETERPITAQARPSRLDVRPAETARQIPVPVLSQIVKTPSTSSGASILQLAVTVRGTDAKGKAFERRFRTNLRPVSKSCDARPSRGVLHTKAQVSEVRFQNGVVSALRLTRGTRSRCVKVSSPALRSALAALDYGQIRGRTFTFGVQKGELLTFFRDAGDSAPATDDRGIEAPVREVTRPRSEASDTDYPLATRFVRAPAFSPRADGRTINRIVIHITDGGARIDGPISWFQNPESRVSAHYIVGQDGEVVQMVHDRDIAWHANSANGDTIGIEHCARAPRAGGESGLFPTPIQYRGLGGARGVAVRAVRSPRGSRSHPGTLRGGPPDVARGMPEFRMGLGLLHGNRDHPRQRPTRQ